MAWISPTNMTVERGCSYEVKLLLSNAGQATGLLKVDSAVLAPAYTETMAYANARK